MALEKYHAKRDFSKTPEPKGLPRKSKSKKLTFVVQEHHASQLHYDFRLELDGVLKSWAVPKGPSMNPHDRHLAVMTEDHPYEYRKFEGEIPEGHYGAGNVIIWDEGTYEPYNDKNEDPEDILRRELKKGHLTFIVHGTKLKGEFALIKMHGTDQKAWLLIKKGDQFASSNDIKKQTQSVKSGKTVDEIGKGGSVPDVSKFPKKGAPWTVKPMLATLVDEIFDDPEWIFEVKWDGYRAIASKHKDDIELYSRNLTDFRTHYPAVVEALRALKHDVTLDGEIVILDDDGRPHFEWIQNYRHEPVGHLYYYAFDILWLDGHDVRTMPLVERKRLLESVLPSGDGIIRYGDFIQQNGNKLFQEMRRSGLEGVIAKKADGEYKEGIRGRDWLKIKTGLRQEVVIGGYTEPRGGRKYIGSLVVGVYDRGNLSYVGHSGGGIPDNQRKDLLAKLQRLERKSSPFVHEPKPNAPVHWVRPELVCEMSFSEWTEDGYMRHPQFEGLRSDKNPLQIHREKAKTAKAATKKEPTMNTKLELTHLDKIFFPKPKITKGDMIEYYRSVADFMLPYLKDRPHSLNRHPNGITGESFYQKNNPHLPEWVPHADIYSDSNEENLRWVVGKDIDTLLYMVQLGCIEINPWNSRVGHLDKPDWIVMDLDPEGIGFKEVVIVAKTVKEVCDELKISTHPKTSGKTGIHIYIALQAKYSYEQARNLAHLIAIEVNKRQPKITSVERMPEKRKHKIYVDYLQNREGQTLAAPYSLRPTPEATVSMPLHWEEVTLKLKPTDFTIKNARKRLDKTGDLWKPLLGKGLDLKKVIKSLETTSG